MGVDVYVERVSSLDIEQGRAEESRSPLDELVASSDSVLERFLGTKNKGRSAVKVAVMPDSVLCAMCRSSEDQGKERWILVTLWRGRMLQWLRPRLRE
jgi:hypothetical protein